MVNATAARYSFKCVFPNRSNSRRQLQLTVRPQRHRTNEESSLQTTVVTRRSRVAMGRFFSLFTQQSSAANQPLGR
jgi:hypothetical protein